MLNSSITRPVGIEVSLPILTRTASPRHVRVGIAEGIARKIPHGIMAYALLLQPGEKGDRR